MRFVFFFFFFFFFFGCTNGPKTLPSSTGLNSEVIFVVDDFLWEKSINSLAKNIFGAEIQGVNQKEDLFRIIQVTHAEFKSILKTHKNIIIISPGVERLSQENKWALDQLVVQLNWKNDSQKLLKELIQLRQIFVQKEVRLVQKSISQLSQANVEKKLFQNFKVEYIIPREYNIIEQDDVFFWANYDPKKSDEIKNIFIFSFKPNNTNLQSQVLAKIDSVFAKFLIGAKEGSYARIEHDYPPYYFENTYRGLWKLENGFMGGPFLAKTNFIKSKIVVSVGIVFAPQNRKRKYIKEFEAIL